MEERGRRERDGGKGDKRKERKEWGEMVRGEREGGGERERRGKEGEEEGREK